MVGRTPSFALVLLLTAAACGGGEDGTGDLALPSEVDEAMDSAYARFADAYERSDAELLADLYTPDALYLPPEGDVLRGRPAIEASFESFFETAASQDVEVRIRFSSVERRGTARLAYDVGYYLLEFANGGQTFASSRGKFTTVWTPGPDGRWRIHVDTFNPAVPPEPPADTAGADTAGAAADTARPSGGGAPPR